MHNKLTTGCLLAGIAVLSQTAAVAIDTVYLKAGSTRAGTVESQNKDNVVFKTTKGVSETVPVVGIDRIAFSGEPASLRIAISAENAGRFQDALTRYDKVKSDFKGSGSSFGKEMQFLEARATARMALTDASKLASAVTKLESFRSANTTNYRYHEALIFLGRCYMAQQNSEKAKEIYGLLKGSAANSHRMTAQIAEAHILLSAGSTKEALDQFKQVAAMNAETPGEQANKFAALLGTAECQKADGQFPEAITSLEKVIEQVPSDEKKVQAKAYVLQGDCYREQKQYKAAAIAYLHVDVLFTTEQDLHAEALYRLGEMWNMTEPKHPQRAEQAITKLKSAYPNSTWAKQ